MRRRKRHWWDNYNWTAPFYAIGYFINEFYDEHFILCHRVMKYGSAIILGIILAFIIPHQVDYVIGRYETQKRLEMKIARQMEEEAQVKVAKWRAFEEEQRRIAKQCSSREELRKKEEYEETIAKLNEEYVIGNYIYITEWNTYDAGPLIPEGASRTGQIRKIIGMHIYGTWGDGFYLDYERDHFHNISHKEYLESRKKEQKQKDKKLKKKGIKYD